MFGLFGKKTGSLVGIDIGSSSVKLVALSQSGRSYVLDAYAIVSFSPSAVVDGNIQDVSEVGAAIEKAVKVAGGKLSAAVTAVPDSAVITKVIQMSTVYSELELEEQIKLEADQFIPYPLEEVALDFEVQDSSSENPKLNNVMLVACKKTDVEQREEVVGEAGLISEVVDVDTYAVERAMQIFASKEEGQHELMGIVDIGASTLTLNVLNDSGVIYTREQAFGGNDLTNLINQQYGIKVEEIEQQLRLGDLSKDIHDSVVLPFRNTVAQQVSRALQFFYSSGAHGDLDVLYLSGGTSCIEGLEGQLQEELGIKTFVADPFSAMKVNSRVNQVRLKRDAQSLVKAAGLALRGLEG